LSRRPGGLHLKRFPAADLSLAALTAGLTLAVASPAAAKPASPAEPSRAFSILRRAMLRAGHANVVGEMVDAVCMPDGTLRTTLKRVVRRADGRALTVCLDGPADRRMVKLDDGVWSRTYDPWEGIVRSTRSLTRSRNAAAVDRIMRLIGSNYLLRRMPDTHLAGRPCHVIELVPRDPSGRVVKVWLDRETGVTLSRHECTLRGATLGVMYFTTVRYPRRLADRDLAWRFPATARRETLALSPLLSDVAALRKRARFDIYVPLAMPGGFEFEACELALSRGQPAAVLYYTDGVANITVCQRPIRSGPPAGLRAVMWEALPRGESTVITVYRRTALMVFGPRDVHGLMPIARALDADRERVLLDRLARQYRIERSVLVEMRNRGLGVDSMAGLFAIVARTGRRVDQVVSMHRAGWGWPQIARHMRLDVRQIAAQVSPYRAR